jgi:hypothetical protein
MIQSLIKFVLSKLAGITARQWAVALHYVIEVTKSDRFKSGAERKAAVTNNIKSLWPEIQSFALNLLIETAVAFTRKNK